MDEALKIAAIDMGTNSFHMIISTIDDKGVLSILNREKEMVRLGSSGGDMKKITPAAEKRALNCLKSFAKIAEGENAEIVAIATSATREAENKEDFIRAVKEETGIEVNVVSGIEEARLIFLGASHALPIYKTKTLLFDIGGGSTETVIGSHGKVDFARSTKLGTVRLTKKYFDKEKINKEDIAKCSSYIKGEWATTLLNLSKHEFNNVVFTSGTLENLVAMAAINNGQVLSDNLNGLTVKTEDILKVIDLIKSKKQPSKIKNIEGIDPQRADIILAGALIIEHAIYYLKIDEVTVSNFALREGVLFDYFNRVNDLEESKHLSRIRLRTVMNLVKRYNCDAAHAEHIRQISLKIFDATREVHGMGLFEEELLEAASLLHDCGFFISFSSHHKHSYYLIMNSEMPGFTNDESELIANIARYHRKSLPKKRHSNFNYLTKAKKRTIWILGGILRLAEGIDRRQKAYIKDLNITIDENGINIKLINTEDSDMPDIELWGAKRRKDMLEEALDKKISISL